MAQSTFSVRMDEDLKKQFDFLCSQFGMTASTAINIYARAVVRERKIPFEIKYDGKTVSREQGIKAFNSLRALAKENGISDMPLEDINSEIDKARGESER